MIPYFYYPYSHNMLVDVGVEQGIVGMVVFAIILLGTAVALWRYANKNENSDVSGPAWLTGALLASLLVIVVHGLVTDTLYGLRGTPLLFAVSGLSMAMTRAASRGGLPSPSSATRGFHSRTRILGPVAFAGLFLILAITFHRSLMARWYANLGAVSIARVELREWPSGKWEDGSNRDSGLQLGEEQLAGALAWDSNERTALQRLGGRALVRRDFTAAQLYLQAASQAAPDHRGVRKMLGFALLWSGNFDQAEPLLATLAESGAESEAYASWWRDQGREDLAAMAALMVNRLK